MSAAQRKAREAQMLQQSRQQAQASLKSVTGEEIAKVLLQNCQYDAAPFSKQRSHRLKEFASELLTEMGALWSGFAAYAAEVQRAAVNTTRNPPPRGSLDVDSWKMPLPRARSVPASRPDFGLESCDARPCCCLFLLQQFQNRHISL